MSATATSYPAKILLFGEHVLLRGGTGLSVPYPALSLRWVRDRPDERLLQFADYLRLAIPPDLLDGERLTDELLADLRLRGNVPVGYGLGSSGAVCAAIWDVFATERGRQCSLTELRRWFARMEQHFHGKSSGTDPLISYTNRGFLLEDRAVSPVELTPEQRSPFFLVDTGQPRSAGPLIQDFLHRWDSDPDFRQRARVQWLAASRRGVRTLTDGEDSESLYRYFTTVSTFQLRELPHFIPEPFRAVWNGGAAYRLKLCGAGGGGMLLGLARERAVVEETFGAAVRWLGA